MPRMRTIKPGFFTNDALAGVDPLGRILFAGLWCHADREGRLEDRPRKLKAEVLPYDDCDVDSLLNSLVEAGFITRYESGGHRYIAVQNFCKHQTPHIKEPASTIPAPCEHESCTVPTPGKPVSQESPITVTGTDPDTGAVRVLAPVKHPKAGSNVPPSAEEVAVYFAGKSTKAEGRKFFLHYEANGWKVGPNKMKNWMAAASMWIARGSSFTNGNGTAVDMPPPQESEDLRRAREQGSVL